ncbi:MAG TPA: hypothetical protein VFI30_00800 [Nocardioidaceae bacterium]|nr:hypothetical protein [Nocardioidaceae bacterium]
MAITTQSHRVPMTERMHMPRTRGAASGFLLILLGVWGGIIPFIGPIFDYAYTPDSSWYFTMGRLWLEILPAAAAVLGGLMILGSANRATASVGGWLAAAGGAWFVVGPIFSELWNGGAPQAGTPVGVSTLGRVVQEVGFFAGLGVCIVFLAAMALGRTSVVGIRDLRTHRLVPTEDDGGSQAEPLRTGAPTARSTTPSQRRRETLDDRVTSDSSSTSRNE